MVETDLHQRLVYGDESALAEAYDAFGGLVHHVALRVTRSPAAAEDVAQEVFTHLWSRPYAFDPRRGTLRTWLSMLAHRRAVDWVRGEERHRKAAHTLSAEPRQEATPADPDIERSLLLHAALAELPLPQRQIVHLAYFAGRTYRQAAAELGIPEGTAKTRLRAALHKLADLLADPPGTAVERGV
ncbi:sigma-70 family RNA polymerase sigma factor [Streptomyces sp. NPDC050504]|uniref:sigma-70 family RNA polymerase sigma factor n=1 Tax=Streptomyces sp. NPDC050504 TaxID=3365618 RepID=UPI0037A886B2